MQHSLILIPVLGCLKNYVKYKKICPILFMRTPVIYIFLHLYLTLFNYKNRICLTIINERIIMFIYKIIMAICNNSYHKKRIKYQKKYNLEYESP